MTDVEKRLREAQAIAATLPERYYMGSPRVGVSLDPKAAIVTVEWLNGVKALLEVLSSLPREEEGPQGNVGRTPQWQEEAFAGEPTPKLYGALQTVCEEPDSWVAQTAREMLAEAIGELARRRAWHPTPPTHTEETLQCLTCQKRTTLTEAVTRKFKHHRCPRCEDGRLALIKPVYGLTDYVPREEEGPLVSCPQCGGELRTAAHVGSCSWSPAPLREAAPGPTPPRDEPEPAWHRWSEGPFGGPVTCVRCGVWHTEENDASPCQAPAEAVTVEQGWALRRKEDGTFYREFKNVLFYASFIGAETDCSRLNGQYEVVRVERRVTVREGAGTENG